MLRFVHQRAVFSFYLCYLYIFKINVKCSMLWQETLFIETFLKGLTR